MAKTNLTSIQRFFAKVDCPGQDCWEWQGAASCRGYGRVSIKGIVMTASRASWLLLRGPIPNGMMVCHHCDNKICVNPDHLYIGTAFDNARDALERGLLTGPLNPEIVGHNRLVECKRGHPRTPENRYRGGCIPCMRMFHTQWWKRNRKKRKAA